MTDVKTTRDATWAHFDGMTWPVPNDQLHALEHQLRNGEPSADDLKWAASVIAAYRQVIQDPRMKREHVVRTLRKVMSGPHGKVGT